MPMATPKQTEIAALLEHIRTLSGDCNDASCGNHRVKISHALRKSQELSDQERETALQLIRDRSWEELKAYLRRI